MQIFIYYIMIISRSRYHYKLASIFINDFNKSRPDYQLSLTPFLFDLTLQVTENRVNTDNRLHTLDSSMADIINLTEKPIRISCRKIEEIRNLDNRYYNRFNKSQLENIDKEMKHIFHLII